jgi:hypothetical protein
VARARQPNLARIPLIAGRVLLGWLAALARRLGDRLFAMNDAEAYWRSWQITRTHGGLARIYRDPRFDTLAECPKCRGEGIVASVQSALSTVARPGLISRLRHWRYRPSG